MPIDFPSSPSNDQSYTYNNFVWVYNTTANAWISQGVSGGAGGGFTSGTTAPASPSAGDEWFDTTTGILFKYINDGNSSQWIQPSAGPQGFQGTSGITTGKSIAMAIVFGG